MVSELREQVEWARGVELALDAQKAVNAETNAALAEVQRKIALLDSVQKNVDNQIEAFRLGINEQFRRLREGIGNGAG